MLRSAGPRKEQVASPASEPAGAAPLRLPSHVGRAISANRRPRHGRRRAVEFGDLLRAFADGALQNVNFLQTLETAALRLRIVLLKLRPWESVLQLPEFTPAAVQARQAGGQLPLQRLLLALAGAAGKANGRAVGPDALPLPIGEVVQRLGLFAFLARRGGRLRLPEGFPIHLLASQLLQQERRALRRATRVEPALEQPAVKRPAFVSLPSPAPPFPLSARASRSRRPPWSGPCSQPRSRRSRRSACRH